MIARRPPDRANGAETGHGHGEERVGKKGSRANILDRNIWVLTDHNKMQKVVPG